MNKNVFDAIEGDCRIWYPHETGGILMGYYDSVDIVVNGWIDGGKNAIRNKQSFIPDHDYQVEKIKAYYESCGRRETYLGDWHTHPDAKAYLSQQDKNTLKKIAQFKLARIAEPIMVILGTNPYEIKGWFYRKGKILIGSHFVESRIKLFQ